MQKLVFTNGGGQTIDLTSGNFGITNWEGLSGVGLNIQTQQVPFQDGGVFLDALMEQREISVTVAIQDNNDLSARYERKRQLISALNPKLGEGVLVYTNDYLSRQIKAVPQLPIFENKNSNDAGTLKASVTFSCPSPYWEDLEEKTITFSSEEQPIIINEGDVPAQVEIDWITKNVTDGEIINVTNGKKIKYNGQLQNGLKINTNLGKKSVVEQSQNMEITNTALFNRFKFVNNNLFCLCDQSNILRSSDGKNWKGMNVPFQNVDFFDVCYVETEQAYYFAGREVLSVDSNIGVVVKLDNSGNWTKTTVITNPGYLNAIIYIKELNILITGGTNLYSSSDGTTWTNRNSRDIKSIIYKNGIILAVGNDGVCKSINGVNWNQTYDKTVFNIAFSEKENIFIFGSVNENNVIKKSADGETWETVTFESGEKAYYIYYVKEWEKYILITYSKKLYISLDSASWVRKQTFTNDNAISNLSFDENLGVMYAKYSKGYAISYDGENWEYVPTTKIDYAYNWPTGTQFSDIAYGNNKYMVVSNDNYASGFILESEDGENWESKERGVYAPIYRIIFSKTKKYFLSVGGNRVTKTEDGETWENVTVSGAQFVDVLEANNEFCACGWSGFFATSPDGLTWSKSVAGSSSNNYREIAWSKSLGLYVLVGEGGIIYTSSDKTNWTSRTSGTNNNLNSVLYSDIAELFIAVGDSGTILTSPDGITWTARGTETNNLNRVVYLELYGSIIIVGNSGTILTSIDGTNWAKLESDIAVNLNGIEMGNNLVAVGGVVTIITSKNEDVENAISKITLDSDIGFNLEIGRNRLRINKTAGEMNARIKYRQKYIGV